MQKVIVVHLKCKPGKGKTVEITELNELDTYLNDGYSIESQEVVTTHSNPSSFSIIYRLNKAE